MNFQDLLFELEKFWSDQGCVIGQPYDIEVGAGTMNPATFLKVLDDGEWRTAYVEPSRRPADGRYGDNPQRLEKHWQFQVVVKPSPSDIQDIYLKSLERIGIITSRHDIRFEEDNWEAPTLGAWGVGWQVLVDGTEITQFTYFQQVGGIELAEIPVEITYGLERIAIFLNNVDSFYDLKWNDNVGYKTMRHRGEREFSRFNFELADINRHFRMFELCEEEALYLLENDCVLPAYDYCLKCSHMFNVLDARGALSVTERAGYIKRIRDIACAIALKYSGKEKKNELK